MLVINDEQRKRDEKALAAFLIFFDLGLLGLFLFVCFFRAA